MTSRTNRPVRHLVPAVAAVVAIVGWSSPSDAYVQQFLIDSTSSATYTPVGGGATSYTIYSGRIIGALDPNNPHNTIITDINLAPKTKGNVNYVANYEIVTPTDPSQRTGLMIYEVPNRGGNAISTSSLEPGVTYVQSGWQGDLLTQCTSAPVPLYPCTNLNSGPYGTPRSGNTAPSGPQTAFVIQVPVATSNGQTPNGSNTITGKVYGHIKAGSNGSTAQLVTLRFGVGAVPACRLRPSKPRLYPEHVKGTVLESDLANDSRSGRSEDADYQLDLGKLSKWAAGHAQPLFYLPGQRHLRPELAL